MKKNIQKIIFIIILLLVFVVTQANACSPSMCLKNSLSVGDNPIFIGTVMEIKSVIHPDPGFHCGESSTNYVTFDVHETLRGKHKNKITVSTSCVNNYEKYKYCDFGYDFIKGETYIVYDYVVDSCSYTNTVKNFKLISFYNISQIIFAGFILFIFFFLWFKKNIKIKSKIGIILASIFLCYKIILPFVLKKFNCRSNILNYCYSYETPYYSYPYNNEQLLVLLCEFTLMVILLYIMGYVLEYVFKKSYRKFQNRYK